jgi:hypothetical protein
MLDFAEQTGSGIVIMVWSFLSSIIIHQYHNATKKNDSLQFCAKLQMVFSYFTSVHSFDYSMTTPWMVYQEDDYYRPSIMIGIHPLIYIIVLYIEITTKYSDLWFRPTVQVLVHVLSYTGTNLSLSHSECHAYGQSGQ